MCGTHTFTYTHTLHFIVSSHSQVWYSAYLSTRVGGCLFVDSLFICRLGIYLVYYAGSIGSKVGFRKKWKQNSFLGELRYQEEVTLQKNHFVSNPARGPTHPAAYFRQLQRRFDIWPSFDLPETVYLLIISNSLTEQIDIDAIKVSSSKWFCQHISIAMLTGENVARMASCRHHP